MAITRAQQAKQMLQDGGRIGFANGAQFDAARRGESISPGTKGRTDPRSGPQIRDDNPFTGGDSRGDSKVVTPRSKPTIKGGSLSSRIKRRFISPTVSFVNFLGDRLGKTKLARINNAIQRQNYINSLDLTDPEQKEEYDRIMSQFSGLGMDIIAGPEDLENTMLSVPPSVLATDPMTQFKTVDGVSTLGDPGVKEILGQGYQDYLDRNKKDPQPDGISDPCLGPNPPAYCFVGIRSAAPAVEEPEYVNPLSKLTARIAGSQFAADGGRIGAQEGGIMPRLNQLGSGVSSAEQMLQGINQRLESAESTLGGGGGLRVPEGNIPTDTSAFKNIFQGNMSPPRPGAVTPLVDNMGFNFRQEGDMGRYIADNDPGMQFAGYSSYQDYLNAGNDPVPRRQGPQPLQVTPPQTPVAMQTPLSGIPAAGYADGGRINSLEDMDREAFLLGGVAKGLKKAVKGIKKLAKSPIGKAALAYAAFTYGPGLLKGKTLPPSMGFKSRGLFDIIKANPMASIFAASTAAGLMTPKEDKDKFDLDSYYASGKLNPSQSIRMMGSDFYGGQRIASAEGGSTDKEPVAKKTMPLLDMGGKEMDLREEGGFVPIGRMEKADDVPARLSKNEFVFTADAVRNAGEGDVDKGAEVMYNMMKNLEAGGEVSEESQGLEGARKMFQTSQRLEEVL